jgi:AraC-like DNA-binding protein
LSDENQKTVAMDQEVEVPRFFGSAIDPEGEERGRTVFRFSAEPTREIRMTHVSAVVPPERPFELDYKDADGKVVTFEIEPRFLVDVVRRADIVPLKLERWPFPRFLVNQRVDQLCSLLTRETEDQTHLGSLYFEGLATSLVIAVVSQTDARLPEAGNLYVQNERIQKAVAYIEANFRSKLTRSQMAAAAHLSDFHFSRLFSRLVGLSPEAYLLDCRLRYAQKLLALGGSECSLAEVAADAGFFDQSHFSRQFRRVFGETPHEYRQHK